MKVILAPPEAEPAVKMKCDCGAEFWTDPAFEENLGFNGKELVAVCPICNKMEQK